jgi:hypothetical protein
MIPERELLELIGKTEQEQVDYLVESKFIRFLPCTQYKASGVVRMESLADLADRLWQEAIEKAEPEISCSMAQISRICGKRAWVDFFAYSAKPIHRIIAAIIALQRAGVEI